MDRLAHMRKMKLTAVFLAVFLVITLLTPPVNAVTIPFFTEPYDNVSNGGGGTRGEVAPRGFSVYFNNASGPYGAGYHGWLSSTYSNACFWPVYVGEEGRYGLEGRNGVEYIDPSAGVSFYAWVEKRPVDYEEYIEFYQDGVSWKEIDGLTMTVINGNEIREDTFADPSGQTYMWRIPITVTGLEEGHYYEFAFLRGLRANNDMTLVISQDGTGYLGGFRSFTTDEIRLYTEHKFDEYQYRQYAYTFDGKTLASQRADVPTNDEGSFYPFRFGFSTKADTPVRKGDVNGDGLIDIADVTRLLGHVYGTTLLEGGALLAADVAADGRVDIADVMRILDHVYGVSFLEE